MRRHSRSRIGWFLVALGLGVCLGGVSASAWGQEAAPGDLADDATADDSTAAPTPVGYLQGQVTIGPLEPVERIGVPRPTPSPVACTSRGLVLFTPDGATELMRVSFQPDCAYQVELPAGTYQVQLRAQGIDRSRELPQTVTIVESQTTELDLSIDTGIR